MNLRGFLDGCVEPSGRETLSLLYSMGYTRVLIPAELNLEYRESNVKILRRSTIKARTRKNVRLQIEEALRREKPDIIVVEPENVDVARYAATHKRVNIIRVTPGMERIVDESTAILLRQKGYGALEVSLNHMLEPSYRTWRYLYFTLRRAAGYSIPIVFSSCAKTPSMTWHPYHIAGIGSILGIPPEKVLAWLSNSYQRLFPEDNRPG